MPERKAYMLNITQHDDFRLGTMTIPHSLFYTLIALLALMLCVLVGGAVQYWKLSSKLADYTSLAQENKEMRMENQNYRTLSQHIREKMSFLEIMSKKLMVTAGLETVKAGSGEAGTKSTAWDAPTGTQPTDDLKQLEQKMVALESTLRKVNDAYNEQFLLTAYTPSIWPVPGSPSRGFGMKSDPWTGEDEHHRGIDIPAPYGQRVQASADGVVIFAGYRGDYGNLVIIDHKFGLSTLYGHLMRSTVRAGQSVRRHDVIGYVGSTGRSTGPHLHYEVRVNNAPVNPRRFLTGDMASHDQPSMRKRTDAD